MHDGATRFIWLKRSKSCPHVVKGGDVIIHCRNIRIQPRKDVIHNPITCFSIYVPSGLVYSQYMIQCFLIVDDILKKGFGLGIICERNDMTLNIFGESLNEFHFLFIWEDMFIYSIFWRVSSAFSSASWFWPPWLSLSSPYVSLFFLLFQQDASFSSSCASSCASSFWKI